MHPGLCHPRLKKAAAKTATAAATAKTSYMHSDASIAFNYLKGRSR